jgi:hypothetical protein
MARAGKAPPETPRNTRGTLVSVVDMTPADAGSCRITGGKQSSMPVASACQASCRRGARLLIPRDSPIPPCIGRRFRTTDSRALWRVDEMRQLLPYAPWNRRTAGWRTTGSVPIITNMARYDRLHPGIRIARKGGQGRALYVRAQLLPALSIRSTGRRGGAPPAAAYSYAPGRGGEHAMALLKCYTGVLETEPTPPTANSPIQSGSAANPRTKNAAPAARDRWKTSTSIAT